MKTYLDQKEEKWDMYHQDDLLWGKGITDIVKRMVTSAEHGQIEQRNADNDSGGVEGSIHGEEMKAGGIEKPEVR